MSMDTKSFVSVSTGQYIRDICVYGIGDLPWLIETESMFANKFETASFPEALDCLELWHRHKVLQHAAVPIQPSWRLTTEVEVNNSTLILKPGDCFWENTHEKSQRKWNSHRPVNTCTQNPVYRSKNYFLLTSEHHHGQ